jgi:hypothetical protein
VRRNGCSRWGKYTGDGRRTQGSTRFPPYLCP